MVAPGPTVGTVMGERREKRAPETRKETTMITTRSTPKTFIERQAAAHIAVARLDSWARLRDELAVLGGLYGMSKPEAARWAAQQAAEIRHAVLNAQGRPEASPAAHETRDVRF